MTVAVGSVAVVAGGGGDWERGRLGDWGTGGLGDGWSWIATEEFELAGHDLKLLLYQRFDRASIAKTHHTIGGWLDDWDDGVNCWR